MKKSISELSWITVINLKECRRYQWRIQGFPGDTPTQRVLTYCLAYFCWKCYQCCQVTKISNVSGQVVSVSRGCALRLMLGTRLSCSQSVSSSSKTIKRLHRKSHHAPRRSEQVTTRLTKTYKMALDFLRFLRQQTKLRKGNVSTGIYLSVNLSVHR